VVTVGRCKSTKTGEYTDRGRVQLKIPYGKQSGVLEVAQAALKAKGCDHHASWLKLTWDSGARVHALVCQTTDEWRYIFEALGRRFDMSPREYDEAKWNWAKPEIDLLLCPVSKEAVDGDASLFVADADLASDEVRRVLETFGFKSVTAIPGRTAATFGGWARPTSTRARVATALVH
jgi:hypothetical protein